MTWLDYFASIINGKQNPLPWRVIQSAEYSALRDIEDIATQDVAEGLFPGTADAIALLGNCADELLAVIRAAENYPSRMLADHAWGDAEYDAARALDEALAALRAKVESMK